MSRTLKLIPVLMAILLFASFTSTAMAITYYVNPAAVTSGTGLTSAITGTDRALVSISAALGKVVAGDTVILYAGPYAETLALSAATPDCDNTTWKAAKGETVIITGNAGAACVTIATGVDGVTLKGLQFKEGTIFKVDNLVNTWCHCKLDSSGLYLRHNG